MLTRETTDDGSTTFWNEQFQESYHSSVGAYTEALEKHVRACRIPELAAGSDALCILDLCFGLGYNSAVAIHEAKKANPNIVIEITALENDFTILNEISNLDPGDELQPIMHKFAGIMASEPQMVLALPCFSLYEDDFSLDLLVADAEISIMCLNEDYYDAIFFDPFSPKVCSELWQVDFIHNVVSKAKPGAYISTFSSARVAKDNFAAAGCEILEGPKLNRRDGGVLARKN